MDKDNDILIEKANRILLSLPQDFEVNGHVFSIYPNTLGKIYLLSPLYEQLEINKEIFEIDPTLEIMRVVEDKTHIVCYIIAYSTYNKKDDIDNSVAILERASFFKNNCNIEDLSKILLFVMEQDDIKDVQDFFGITKEHQLIAKINKIKDKSSSLDFCGKSIFGSLIVPACEKLNLTPMQVLWDISYSLLRMLMADAPVSVYLSDKERKMVHIPQDRTRINADTKEGMEQIKRMNWN